MAERKVDRRYSMEAPLIVSHEDKRYAIWRDSTGVVMTVPYSRWLWNKQFGALKTVKIDWSVYDSENPRVMVSKSRRYASWYNDGRYAHIEYARLVWQKSHGKIPDGCYIHHRDGDSMNDDVENLACVTPKEHSRLHKILRDENRNIQKREDSRFLAWFLGP